MRTKKLLASIIAAMMTVSSFGMVSTNAAVDGPEMITGGSFEINTTGAVVKELGNTAAVSGLEYSSNESFDGTTSIHITKSAQLTTAAKLGMKSGESYNISFYIKGELASTNGMYVRTGWVNYETDQAKLRWNETDGFYVDAGKDLLNVTSAGDGWYKVETTKAWPCGGDANIAVLYPQSWVEGSDVPVEPDFYIDRFSVTDENGNEMVTGGSFEPDTTGAIVTELGNKVAIAGLEYSNDVGYQDNSSIHVTQSGQLTTWSKLGLTSGVKYNFSFMIKGDLHNNGMYLRMGGWSYTSNAAKLIETDGVFSVVADTGDDILKAEAAGNGWYKVETIKPWTCGSGTDQSAALLFPQNSADFYIDNFSITAATGDTVGASVTELGRTAPYSGLEYSNTEAYESEKSIHIVQPTGAWKANSTTGMLGMTAGKSYNVSFYMKGTVGAGFIIWQDKLKITDDATAGFKAKDSSATITVTDEGNGWYKIQTNEALTAATNTSAEYFFRVIGNAVNVYIDNLSITEADTGTEIITNGGFESDTIVIPAGKEVITNGSFEGVRTESNGAIITELGNTAAVAGVEYSTADAYKGNRAVHVSGLSGWTALTTTGKVGMEAGKSYNFSFYVKGIIASTNGMYIRTGETNLNVDQAKIKSDTNGVFSVAGGADIISVTPAENGWYKVETKSAWTCNSTDSNFIYPTTGGGTVDFYIDNLSITEVLPDEEIGAFVMTGDTSEKTVTITVTNNGHTDGYDAILILTTYKGETMQNVAFADVVTTVEMGKTETLTETITVGEGETLTAFLWEGLDSLEPIIPSEVLISSTSAVN